MPARERPERPGSESAKSPLRNSPAAPSRLPASFPSPGRMSPETALALQRSMGNAAVSRLISEEEPVQEEAPVQRSGVESVLRSPGTPLADSVRTDMEARLGADFSGVRLHTGPAARDSAAEIGARAYTSGDHVVIGDGGADTHTLAHELTHVIQQRQGPVSGTDNGSGLSISDPGDRFEREAEATAHRALSGPAPVQRAPETPEDPEETESTVPGEIQRTLATQVGSKRPADNVSSAGEDQQKKLDLKVENEAKGGAVNVDREAARFLSGEWKNPTYRPIKASGGAKDKAGEVTAILPTGVKGGAPNVDFPGFDGEQLDRTHLLANEFGGSGERENIVPFGYWANQYTMRDVERQIGREKAAVDAERKRDAKGRLGDLEVQRAQLEGELKAADSNLREAEREFHQASSSIYYNAVANYRSDASGDSIENYAPESITVKWGVIRGGKTPGKGKGHVIGDTVGTQPERSRRPKKLRSDGK